MAWRPSRTIAAIASALCSGVGARTPPRSGRQRVGRFRPAGLNMTTSQVRVGLPPYAHADQVPQRVGDARLPRRLVTGQLRRCQRSVHGLASRNCEYSSKEKMLELRQTITTARHPMCVQHRPRPQITSSVTNRRLWLAVVALVVAPSSGLRVQPPTHASPAETVDGIL